MKSFLKVFGIAICLIASNVFLSAQRSHAQQLFTFNFETVFDGTPSASFPVPTGTTGNGSFTFNLNTPGSFSPFANTFTSFSDPLTDFTFDFGDFGTANFTGASSSILIGNPVQTTGSENFLSDQYVVTASLLGITIPTDLLSGDRDLISGSIRLQDIDLEALSSESLSTTPPVLSFFEDNIIPGQIQSDEATLSLNFQNENGGTAANSLRITSLSVVPEPSTGIFGVFAFLLLSGQRRRKI